MQKGNFLKAASAEGIALLFPDTSPRGAGAPNETDSWDFGVGAGFYLDATKPEYSKNYNMLTHVTIELPQVIEAAGLPIVSASCNTDQIRLTRVRTGLANPSSAIAWAAMVL